MAGRFMASVQDDPRHWVLSDIEEEELRGRTCWTPYNPTIRGWGTRLTVPADDFEPTEAWEWEDLI